MKRRFMSVKVFNETFDINNYLTVEAIEDGLTVSFENDIEYGIDGKGWIILKKGTNSPKLKVGQTISFKGKLNPLTALGVGTFTISHKCNLLGNVMSLLFVEDTMKQKSLIGYEYAFYKLFYRCYNILSVSDNFLPATTLAPYCYQEMFSGCTSLTTAPELPATILVYNCYRAMFSGCTSLTTAPSILPATTLSGSCYSYMFNGCSNLTILPELPATTLVNGCYRGMFQFCSKLTATPTLPATTLANWCYNSMFDGCSNLNYIKMLATDISASECLTNWARNVSSTGTFVKNPAMTTLPTGIDGIPIGWTVYNDGEKPSRLITFTIDDTEYQAEEGMTWGEWVDSEYNVINASIYLLSSGVGYITLGKYTTSPIIICYSNYNYVNTTQEVITNHNYITSIGGGGGN